MPLTGTNEDGVTIIIDLSPAEQRKIVEHGCQGPVFRMWISSHEYFYLRRKWKDYTYSKLRDGRYVVWRAMADLDKLKASKDVGEQNLAKHIESRMITDDGIV